MPPTDASRQLEALKMEYNLIYHRYVALKDELKTANMLIETLQNNLAKAEEKIKKLRERNENIAEKS